MPSNGWILRVLAVFLAFAMAGCGAECRAPECSLSLTAGPGDGAYVPGALEATAVRFLGPSPSGSGSGADTGGGSRGPGFLRLQIDRDTLTSGHGTVFTVPRNQSFGLRAEVSRPVNPHLRAYAALGAGVGQHVYTLPQGLGPLTDPMRFSFRTLFLSPEAGLVHSRDLPALSGGTLRLSVGTGVTMTRTRTDLTSALLDVSSRDDTAQPYGSLGAGLAFTPRGTRGVGVEFSGQARVTKGGTKVLRGEVRLSR